MKNKTSTATATETPLRVRLLKVSSGWEIKTGDGRTWYTAGSGSRTSRTAIRRAYPGHCSKLRQIGDRVEFDDNKGFFARGR